ncbi:MAG: nucleotidyltransferase domain-containing protein [Candidatus Eisenbacteria bacterium]|nr:nucleotidyltransferase domain-containing protein [Candidatus Eisenbacteria bacterium]
MTELQLESILKETVQRILSVVKPTKVMFFGSASRGEMHENSDIDILVIVPSGTHRRKTAQKIYRNLIGLGFAVDVVVVTEDDIRQFGNNQGMVIHPALTEGKILYAA